MILVATSILVLSLALGIPAAALAAQRPQPPKKPAEKSVRADERPLVKRQNFRARRAEEISPWEGFEDCPLALPCVGGSLNQHGN